jgi:hypothetical protein
MSDIARDFNNIETRAVIKFLFSLQGKAPKEMDAILTETLACFLPGLAKDVSAPLYNPPSHGAVTPSVPSGLQAVPLQGKVPKEIHAILTETLASFLPGLAKDLSAPLQLLKINPSHRFQGLDSCFGSRSQFASFLWWGSLWMPACTFCGSISNGVCSMDQKNPRKHLI